MWNWIRAHWIATEGARLLDQKKHEQAIEIFSQAIRLYPKGIDFYIKRARAYEALKSWQAALADYQSVLALEPGKIDVAFKKIQLKQKLTTEPETKEDLTDLIHDLRAINHKEQLPNALLKRARLYVDQDELEEAFRDLQEYERLAKTPDPTFHFFLAQYWTKKRDYQKALAAATEVINNKKLDMVNAYRLRASIYTEMKEYKSAIEDYTSALKLDPNHIASLNNRSRAFYESKDWQSARIDTERLIELEPYNIERHGFLAYICLFQEDYEKCLTIVNQILERDPNFRGAYAVRRDLFIKQENYESALLDANKTLNLIPDDTYDYFQRAFIFMQQHKYPEALADCNAALDLKSDSSQSYVNRAEVYFSLNNYSAALADFQKAQELGHNANEVKAGIAVTQHALGNVDEAQRLWRELITADENYREAKWVGEQHHWLPALSEEAEKLIQGMQDV